MRVSHVTRRRQKAKPLLKLECHAQDVLGPVRRGCCLPARSSWPSSPGPAGVQSTVRTVPIYATVVDASGRLVPDLEHGDFTVPTTASPPT